MNTINKTMCVDFEKKQKYFNEEVNKLNQFYTKQIEEVMKFVKPAVIINSHGEYKINYDEVTQKQIDLIMSDRKEMVERLYKKIFKND